ncbi:MAG: T9SS type A sorting domain-containing protein, partial [Bacteroidetes bacterium]|nr:T9SS type A sorting domain-containing protein [Bacteroidota bacterium]
ITVGGCASLPGTTTVTVSAAPATPTASNTGPYCAGATITLATPTVTGATYSWTGPGAYSSAVQNPTRPSATTAMAGTYSVTVTIGSCVSAAGTTTVVVNALPATPAASNTGPYCAGATISLSTPNVGGATYSWTGPASFTSTLRTPTRPASTTAMAGTYSVTITNAAGCTSLPGTTTVVVNPIPATPTAGSNSPVCTGSTILLTSNTVTGATYSWTGPATFTSAVEDPSRPSATTAMAGTYSVTVTVAGCTSLAGTTAVTVSGSVTPTNTITASPSGSICSGTAVTFTAASGGGGTTPTYQWQVNGSNVGTGGVTFMSSTLVNGDLVTCVMTSSSSCATSSTATSNTITMAVTTSVTPTVSIAIGSGTNPTCSGVSVMFTATSTNGGSSPSYQWQINGANAGTSVATFTSSTLNNGDVVTCILTSNAVCASPLTVTSTGITMVVNPTPATPTITVSGSDLISSSATGNQWYLNGVLITGATSQNYTFTANGTYTVVVTIAGCSSTASAPMVITTTGITDAANPYLLSIYPNPNDGNFNVSFNVADKGTYKLELINSLGQLIFREELKDFSGMYHKQLSVVEFGKGVYTITLTSDKNDVVKKIIVY